MDAVTYPDPAVQTELSHWNFLSVDISEHRSVADRFAVVAIPVAVAVTPEGEELGRVVGFAPAQELIQTLAELRNSRDGTEPD